ncbi:hypothetical protein [Streptomyces sp. NPDC048603]|uniref:hypothetical protein n=1 Tax=Streptomyces sp. NPDC048603 TaxID=3365577 RepID=UPI003715FD60
MTDQRLSLPDDDDDADERAFRAMSAFKENVRGLVQETGLSGNALGKKLGYPDGKVSLWSTASPYQAHLPRIDFVEALVREAQERGNVQAAAADAFVREYGDVLQLYCARRKPHSVHVAMLAEYRFTVAIREMTAAMNEVRSQEVSLRAELEALRDDRNGQRARRQALQRQLEELSRQHARLATDRQAAVARRDQAQADLAVYEAGQEVEVHVGPEARMQGQHGLEQGSSYANHPLLPTPSGAPVSRQLRRTARAAALVASGVVLSLAGYGAFALLGGESKDDAKGGQAVGPTPGASPVPVPQASPPASASGGPASPSKSAAPVAAPHPNEPLPLVLTSTNCDAVIEIDFDKVPLLRRMPVSTGEKFEPAPGVDMTFSGCSPDTLRTLSGRYGGTVRKGKEFTKDTCRSAAQGGGLEDVGFRHGGTPEYRSGIGEGAVICVITDQNRLVAAKVNKLVDGFDTTMTLEVSTLT